MNWVDFVIVGALIFFALTAIGRSFLSELLDLISFLLAGFLSFLYYNLPAKFFESQFQIPHGLSLVLGFMVVWFFSEIFFFLMVRLLLPVLPAVKIPGSKILSMVPAALRGLVFISLALVLTSTFPIQPVIKKSVLESVLGSKILKYAYNLEAPVKSVFGGVANDSLTFLTIKPKTDERVNLGFQTSQLTADPVNEAAMTGLVNKERSLRGLNILVSDQKLRDVARLHSEDMFKRGYFSHFSPEEATVADRVQKAGVNFLVVEENLAYAPGLELAHKGLMNSEGHRVNILSEDYHKIGIGVMDGGVYGMMFTQVFSN